EASGEGSDAPSIDQNEAIVIPATVEESCRCEEASAEEKILTAVTQAVFMNGSSAVDLEAGYNLPLSVIPYSSLEKMWIPILQCLCSHCLS
ncbi:hypothetical protein KI387_037596, partial [Taxus chinensis]